MKLKTGFLMAMPLLLIPLVSTATTDGCRIVSGKVKLKPDDGCYIREFFPNEDTVFLGEYSEDPTLCSSIQLMGDLKGCGYAGVTSIVPAYEIGALLFQAHSVLYLKPGAKCLVDEFGTPDMNMDVVTADNGTIWLDLDQDSTNNYSTEILNITDGEQNLSGSLTVEGQLFSPSGGTYTGIICQ